MVKRALFLSDLKAGKETLMNLLILIIITALFLLWMFALGASSKNSSKAETLAAKLSRRGENFTEKIFDLGIEISDLDEKLSRRCQEIRMYQEFVREQNEKTLKLEEETLVQTAKTDLEMIALKEGYLNLSRCSSKLDFEIEILRKAADELVAEGRICPVESLEGFFRTA